MDHLKQTNKGTSKLFGKEESKKKKQQMFMSSELNQNSD